MKRILFICVLTILCHNIYAQKKDKKNPLNNAAVEYLNNSFAVYDKLQKTIWANPELGFLETNSSALLQKHLQENGFKVEAGVAGMPTAFVATYGSGSPVIAVLAEYDALPGLSQDTVPYRKPLIEGGSGHGCGHNTFGVGAVAGAIAIKQWLTANNHVGTIKVYGTPAEEGGGGKVYLVRDGLFNGVDVVLDWHPGTGNQVTTDTGTAILMVDYSFFGIASHAGGSPDKGRSALDGVESMNYMVNMLREHVPISSRIHYVIANGGEAPNVVPDYAKVSYYIRSPKREILKDLVEWVGQASEGAALGTQTKVKSEIISGFYEKLNNRKLAELVQKNLEIVGGVHYDARERAFAEEIVKGLNKDIATLKQAETVKPLENEKPSLGGGSSDVGDVSWVVPTVTFNTATFVPGSSGHSWQNVASGGSTIGTKSLINTAKVFSLSAIDLYTDPQLLKDIKDEFGKRRGADFEYTPLLGDRAPALDYRVKK
ncbi:amidohydrolase [Dysgonomonas sp. ZJ279]|uniref:amidohydrolase n=1 Tax=Dysgonomonas sp. ZJ279 TaxID=2709796 RepID=UPI0013EDDEAF|nr:amidohydrolase [Dysgonomonas sp. ZJ279]